MAKKQKNALTAAAIVFGIVALFHLIRLVKGTAVIINGYSAPMELSVLALVVAGYLSYYCWTAR